MTKEAEAIALEIVSEWRERFLPMTEGLDADAAKGLREMIVSRLLLEVQAENDEASE